MGIDHSNPYIHSTTVLCDNNTLWSYASVPRIKNLKLKTLIQDF